MALLPGPDAGVEGPPRTCIHPRWFVLGVQTCAMTLIGRT